MVADFREKLRCKMGRRREELPRFAMQNGVNFGVGLMKKVEGGSWLKEMGE